MRVLRVLLALLLGAGPVQAQPVVDLLSRYAIPADETAASAPEGDAPQGSGKRLAALESDLALVNESLEGFAHPQDADKALLAAKPRLPAGTAPFFKDRTTALGALYRTLAVVDYTWALRFPDPPCAPAAKRSALLRSDDGLFLDPFSGKTSPWMTALLGPSAKGKDLESALDQASASTAPSEAEYARLRARQNLITKALSSEGAVGEARANLYCKRAETRVKLAAANRAAGPMLAARSSREESSRRGLILLAGKTEEGLEVRGAGVVLETKSGIRVLTDRRLGAGEVVALLDGRSVPVPLSVDREDERSGLLLLRPDGDLGEALTLADAAPKKDDLVSAFAHSDRLGAWTKTQGLVTSASPEQFQTDAVADASMTGGAVLDEEGRVAGLLVLRRVAGSTIDWPAAVPAPILREWLDGGSAPAASPVDLTDQGTTKILTASRPLLQSVSAGEGATTAGYGFDTQTQWGSVHARCMANCGDSGPSSSYSGNANAELGEALGKLAVIGAEALIFKGIPALFRGIGSLFKSKPRRYEAQAATTDPESIKIAPPPPKPKPKLPLKPVGMTLSSDKTTVLRGEAIRLTAQVLFTGELGTKAGLVVTFTADTDLYEFPAGSIAATDGEGLASVEMLIKPDVAADAHDALDRETRRMAGEEVEPSARVGAIRGGKPESKVKDTAERSVDALEQEELKAREAEAPLGEVVREVPSMTEAGASFGAAQQALPMLDTASINIRASLGGKNLSAETELETGRCPPGTMPDTPRDMQLPGQPPMGSPSKALLQERCKPFEDVAASACGDRRGCRDELLLALRYDFRACGKRWDPDGDGSTGSVGIPSISPRKQSPTRRCVPIEAKTRSLAIAAPARWSARADGRDVESEEKDPPKSPQDEASVLKNIISKLEFFFGKAKDKKPGDTHNSTRSQELKQSLERIGLQDTPENREHVRSQLQSVMNDDSSHSHTQLSNMRSVKESILTGPKGVLKLVTVWEGRYLITAHLVRE